MNIQNNVAGRYKWAILGVFQAKKLVPQKYFLYAGSNLIGSDSNKCEILIDNSDSIADLHAEILITEEGDASICDLGSKGGTFKMASLNPNKKVKLAEHTFHSILPDHAFFIGKHKCFVVAFDDDYRRGEERRNKILKDQEQVRRVEEGSSQKQQTHARYSQGSQATKNIAVDQLAETDLDDDENSRNSIELTTEAPKQPQEQIEKTLELESCSENDEVNEAFNIAGKQPSSSGNEMQYEKTLELHDRYDGLVEEANLFETGTNSNLVKNDECFQKTLELSDKDSSEDEKGSSLFKTMKKETTNQQQSESENTFEKTLELSDAEDQDDENLFGEVKDYRGSGEAFEKTLELSGDNDEDAEEEDMFSSKKEVTDIQGETKIKSQSPSSQATRMNEKMIDESESPSQILLTTKDYRSSAQNTATLAPRRLSPLNKDYHMEILEATLMDSPAEDRQRNELQATLIDSPQSQQTALPQGKKHLLSPTLVDDDDSYREYNMLSQLSRTKKSHQQRKSPSISLSPTFLDESVELNYSSIVQSQKKQPSQENNRPTKFPSPPTAVELTETLPNTLIDEQYEEESDDEQAKEKNELLTRIKQQEIELKRLKEALEKQAEMTAKALTAKSESNRSNSANNKKEDVYSIKVTETNEKNAEKTKKEGLKKNIDLDRVKNFDDLFGSDEEGEGENHSNSNSRGAHSNSVAVASTPNPSTSLYKQKFLMRTLTMSDNKILNPHFSAYSVSQISGPSQATGSLLSATIPSKGLFIASDVTSSEDLRQVQSKMNKRSNRDNKVEEVEGCKEDEDSDSYGEDTKKRLKVNANWGMLKGRQSSKSGKEDDLIKSNSLTDDKESSRGLDMVAEDEKGREVGSLKISVSGFKLRADQKRGVKGIGCELVDETEEFDVLIMAEAKRTIKLLLALMNCKPIVSENWLTMSMKKHTAVRNFDDFPLTGDSFSARFGVDLLTLVKKRKEINGDNLIFEGKVFYVSKNFSDPSDEEIVSLIIAGGGSIRKTLPNKQMKKDQNVYAILSLKEDHQIYKTLAKLKNVTCVTLEFVLLSAQNSQLQEHKDNLVIDEAMFQ